MSLRVILFSILPIFGQGAVPLFAGCKLGDVCEGTAICRFHICLPAAKPVPVVVAALNRTVPFAPRPVTQRPVARPLPALPNRQVVISPPQRPQLPAPQSVSSIVPTCKPKCIGNARCFQGICQCAPGVIYSIVIGCVPVRRPMAAVPIPPVRIVPQALPGEHCEAGIECSGGSQCSLGICTCPPELIHQGGVCMSPASIGLAHRGLPGYVNSW